MIKKKLTTKTQTQTDVLTAVVLLLKIAIGSFVLGVFILTMAISSLLG